MGVLTYNASTKDYRGNCIRCNCDIRHYTYLKDAECETCFEKDWVSCRHCGKYYEEGKIDEVCAICMAEALRLANEHVDTIYHMTMAGDFSSMEQCLELLLGMSEPAMMAILRGLLPKYGYNTLEVGNDFTFARGYKSNSMLVAHIDTVFSRKPKPEDIIRNKYQWYTSFGIGGDDRCGVLMNLWIIAEHVKNHGSRPAVLFTDLEETGCVGALEFARWIERPENSDKWDTPAHMIEFDRRGCSEAVYYDCANEAFTRWVEGFGWETKSGSTSDIVHIAEPMGCAAVNISACYTNQHTVSEKIYTNFLFKNIQTALEMTLDDQTYFKWVEAVSNVSLHYRNYSSNRWSKYGHSYFASSCEEEEDNNKATVDYFGTDKCYYGVNGSHTVPAKHCMHGGCHMRDCIHWCNSGSKKKESSEEGEDSSRLFELEHDICFTCNGAGCIDCHFGYEELEDTQSSGFDPDECLSIAMQSFACNQCDNNNCPANDHHNHETDC